jgi:sugar phosphate isomerase/epimerase
MTHTRPLRIHSIILLAIILIQRSSHFMTLLSMNEITTFRWSFEEDVENYLQAGYRAIGVWRHKLTDCEEARAIDLLDRSGLRVSNLLWAGGFTGSDGRSLAESIDDAADALRLAAATITFIATPVVCSVWPWTNCSPWPRKWKFRWPLSQCTPPVPRPGRF